MPHFFSFQQGSERAQNVRYLSEASPLLGRFRVVPRPSDRPTSGVSRTAGGIAGGGGGSGGGRGRARVTAGGLGLLPGGQIGLLSSGEPGWRGSVHVGYGALVAAAAAAAEAEALEAGEGQSEEEEGDGDAGEGDSLCCCAGGSGRWWKRVKARIKRELRKLEDTWVEPKASAIRRVVDVWWSRWGALVVLPASLAVAWCAVPFPQYPLPSGGEDGMHRPGEPQPTPGTKVPGHGAARVQVNFWFFLFVYYSFYNLTALIWITKVFNIYSLNWWPPSLGFPITVSAIAILSIAVPIPIYLVPNAKFLTVHNTAWISWTFLIMAMPVAIAFCLLMTHERHLGLRHSLSETQRIFTSSWWAGDPDRTLSNREGRRYLAASDHDPFDSTLGASAVGFVDERYPRRRLPVRLRRQWLPASFVRFVWFCLALSIGLLAYVIGEAYAEIYLSTLPHNNWETIVYVYGWITTVHLLDGLTGWILGGNEGERVGSYPLSWIFKLPTFAPCMLACGARPSSSFSKYFRRRASSSSLQY
ncbi:uncharacterized protein THITE_2121273 [Thermothielavioides terrestris NRRL 8126]|uniref:Uncharacterized protein n=1 Tax=Thermothielavioides terrestris (strain ATCC 38088 / NRRL 8126) TaxID=578455 RepID=G2REQ8_THETT|nr:uncharacterized protein THITE_2121273 [Thermothielavioides terrestris NRRL 8126]AEO70191.1 hypothetical protein THITE_2121273 [Thermothielavioides terrestris NRRL 8126]